MWFLFLSLWLPFVGCNKQKIPIENELIVASSFDYAPFTMMQDKQPAGFEVELIQEIGKRMQQKITFKDMTFKDIVPAVETKSVDMAIAAFSQTAERSKRVGFSKPYYHSPSVAILSLDNDTTSLDDVIGDQVVALLGSSQASLLNEKLLKATRKPTVTLLTQMREVVEAFQADQTRIMVTDQAFAKNLIENNPHLKVKTFLIDNSGYDFVMLFPKKSKLRTKVNKALASIIKDGTLDALKQKHGL